MGKIRDLVKKIQDIKGKMGTIKDRTGMDLTEAEDVQKRWQEYTEELYKKDLHNPDTRNDVITHLEPDILECEVKWVLGSITTNKASGGDGIPVEVFQILKDDAVKVLLSVCQQVWITQQWPQDWKRSVSIPIPKKGNAKKCSNYCTITLISHASKVMLKIPKPGVNSMWTMNLQMFMLDLEKAEKPGIKLPTSVGLSKNQETSRKTSASALLSLPKPLTVWITTNCGKFFKRWEYQATLSASWEICIQVKEKQLELDMEQQTGSKSGKEYIKAVYCHPVYLTYMQSTSCEMLGWMKHKLESRLPEYQ